MGWQRREEQRRTPGFQLRHWAVVLFAKGLGGGEAYGVQLLVSSVSGRLSPRCLLDIQTEMLPEQSTMSFKFGVSSRDVFLGVISV